MTHSLHRLGDIRTLTEDFVILVTPAKDINHLDSKPKLRAILDKVFELGPVNIGSYETGTVFSGASIEEIKNKLTEVPRVRCCFDNKDKVIQLLTFIKDNDFGLSVTISGLIDEVHDIAKTIGIKPHSVNLSLGIWGKTGNLPEKSNLEFITMCGHGLISNAMVESITTAVKERKMSPENAAKELAKPCVCGIFNPTRAEKLFKELLTDNELEVQ